MFTLLYFTFLMFWHGFITFYHVSEVSMESAGVKKNYVSNSLFPCGPDAFLHILIQFNILLGRKNEDY